jgi:hypothetical protein
MSLQIALHIHCLNSRRLFERNLSQTPLRVDDN